MCGDGKVLNVPVPGNEVRLVLGVQHRLLDVVARKRADRVERAPQRRQLEQRPVAIVAAQKQCAQIARRSQGVTDAGRSAGGARAVLSR